MGTQLNGVTVKGIAPRPGGVRGKAVTAAWVESHVEGPLHRAMTLGRGRRRIVYIFPIGRTEPEPTGPNTLETQCTQVRRLSRERRKKVRR